MYACMEVIDVFMKTACAYNLHSISELGSSVDQGEDQGLAYGTKLATIGIINTPSYLTLVSHCNARLPKLVTRPQTHGLGQNCEHTKLYHLKFCKCTTIKSP